jgi:hypothetical protein
MRMGRAGAHPGAASHQLCTPSATRRYRRCCVYLPPHRRGRSRCVARIGRLIVGQLRQASVAPRLASRQSGSSRESAPTNPRSARPLKKSLRGAKRLAITGKEEPLPAGEMGSRRGQNGYCWARPGRATSELAQHTHRGDDAHISGSPSLHISGNTRRIIGIPRH